MKINYSKAILLSLSLLWTSFSYAQDFAKGIVYVDANRNGKFDKGERRLSGVGVSNGVDVVQTDKHGTYKLPVAEDNILFVIRPAGYSVPVDKNNLPQFYYIHHPKGAPDLEYKGVAPTGPLPKSVDFALIPEQSADEFKILVFGDPQVYNEEEVDFLKRGVVEELVGAQGYSFGISLGDLVGNKPSLFNPYIQVMKDIGIPWYQVMGNHDINFDVPNDSLSDLSFKAHFGPNNYSLNKGKVHFIVLDDVLYQGQGAKRGYIGGLRKDQLDYIENDLRFVPKDHLIVLCMHIPIVNNGKHVWPKENINRLFTLLKDFPNTFSMSAHTHVQKQIFIDQSLGWLQDKPHHHYNVGTTSGNWYSGELDAKGVPTSTMTDGTKKGYAVISFVGNQYTVDYFVSGASKDVKMNVFLPKVVKKARSTEANIYVNYFLGGDKDTVEYQVDNQAWKPMVKVEVHDPHLLMEVMKWDTVDVLLAGDRPDNPRLSSHIWLTPIPSNLNKGTHQVRIRVRDMFGRTHMSEHQYEIK